MFWRAGSAVPSRDAAMLLRPATRCNRIDGRPKCEGCRVVRWRSSSGSGNTQRFGLRGGEAFHARLGGVRMRKMPEWLYIGWPAQQVALGLIAEFVREKTQLGLRLDALSQNGE